ncbi:phosphate signaling complex protein PhoU [Roseinatronobacter domitianus]|nr:phosphate signaling complex protein PhoU [Roseibaca domitiana]
MSDKHIVSGFDRDIMAIETFVAQIGAMARDALEDATQACLLRDKEIALRVQDGDRALDTLETQTRMAAIKLLALRAPSAVDLRFVLTVLEVCAHLERCGDYAKNIAKRSLALGPHGHFTGTDRALLRMSDAVNQMLADALAAYLDRDTDKARAVIDADLETDQRYNSLFRGLLTYMMEDPRNITAGMHLHFVAKNLERIGDRATGIAEQVIYLTTGEMPDDDRPKGDMTAQPQDGEQPTP